ncbi:MAG: hypothetical protein H0U49_01875 [Parachlamydiaceae bacterium]|nr:hypothetical protein [Parachlamydiaceae bacterium]
MKIIRIYLKNLNSLRGEFDINLENEPFASSGIFAITGPTGAGKSTILDAITLALYGRAARYGNEKPENMMSQGTGECLAEVIFEVPKGRYRASWQLQRARKKADGKLQLPQRFVYDSEGTPIAQKSTEVDKIIEELTGLDADRFFRSVLLAQGDFVKFLKATPDERATLLESLTGTGIYTEISKKVHQETSIRAHALALREGRLENIQRLNDVDRAALLEKIYGHVKEIESNTQNTHKLADLISKGNHLIKYLEQQASLKSQLNAINKEHTCLEIDSKHLKLFNEGAPYFSDLKSLDQFLKELNEKKAKQDGSERNLLTKKHELRAGFDATKELILQSISESEKAIFNSSAERTQKLEKLNSLNEWLEAHRENQNLDQHISHIVEEITLLTTYRNKLSVTDKSQTALLKSLERHHQQRKALQAEQDDVLIILKNTNATLELGKNENLKILEGKTLDNIQEEIHALEIRLDVLHKIFDALTALEKNHFQIQDLKIIVDGLKIKTFEAAEKKTEEESHLKSELEKIKTLTDELDRNRLIASLHTHRENLELGHSCPLCGSLDHPYVDSDKTYFPQISVLEIEINSLKSNASKKEREIKKQISACATLEEALRNSSENLETAAANGEQIKASLHILFKKQGLALENNVETSEDIKQEITICESMLLKIRSLLKLGKESAVKIHELQNSLVKTEHNSELIQGKITSQEEKIQSVLMQIDALKADQLHSQGESKNLETSLFKYLQPYGLVLPAAGEERTLRESLESLRTTYKDNLKLLIDIKTELNTLSMSSRDLESKCDQLRNQLESLNNLPLVQVIAPFESNPKRKIDFLSLWNTIDDAHESLRRLETELEFSQNVLNESNTDLLNARNCFSECESKLTQDLTNTQFNSIESLRASQLLSSEVQRIQKSENDIKSKLDHCQGQLVLVETELKELPNTEVPQGEKLQEIMNEHQAMITLTNHLRDILAVSRNRLLLDEKNHMEYDKLSKELETDRQRLSVWQKLSNLIGSHDGKNFRKFAQGLSLDLLIKHANVHLSSLNNRYRLKRMPGDELDLEIQDLHQANATRPTASLSGGESFLTSLALALGLSDLAGKNVRIDSLFIDEGFGSLDSDALEIAVQSLESLRSRNKTIGVISHVELLKERISTQIMIEKGSGGVSTMSFSH